jgi:membrane-associated phospholipid phosphatase
VLKRLRQAPGRPLLAARTRPLAAGLLGLCAIVTVGLGAWLAGRTTPTALDARIDPWVIARLWRHARPVLDVVSLGDGEQATVICALLVLACLVTRRFRAAVFVAVGVAAAAAATEFVFKPLFDRKMTGIPGYPVSYLSYPSGHVTGVAALAAAVVVLLLGPGRPPWPAAARRLLAVIALLLVVAVSVGVIAVHYHYVTDTIGGAGVGAGAVLLTAFVVDWLGDRAARPPGPQAPAAADSASADETAPTAGGGPARRAL